MKAILALIFLIASGVFCWRYVMSPSQRLVTGSWGRRVVWAALVGVFLVCAAFGVVSATTWRMF